MVLATKKKKKKHIFQGMFEVYSLYSLLYDGEVILKSSELQLQPVHVYLAIGSPWSLRGGTQRHT